MTTKIKQFEAKGWTPEQLGSLAGKTYVITGAKNYTAWNAYAQSKLAQIEPLPVA